MKTGNVIRPCDLHMTGPSGHLAWHDWAERMSTTHEQQQCTGCGRWVIWVPRTHEPVVAVQPPRGATNPPSGGGQAQNTGDDT